MPSSENGRRSGDIWSRIGKVLAVILAAATVLGFAGKGFLVVHQVSENTSAIEVNHRVETERLTVLEQYRADDHYMTCALFKRFYPASLVPPSCDIPTVQK